ncbi:hypothetical protein [Agarivorans sp. Z349TD_8]|uniref:hypothetical protein n=1 Tax=Agarivorans sp. Z349TD_8 TaxID=3421434 RepID=UPI003D7D3929
MDFFDNKIVQYVTFSIPFIALLVSLIARKFLVAQLDEPARSLYKKLSKDALVKTFLMFSGALMFGFFSYLKSADLTESIMSSLFSLTLFTGINLLWVNRKNSELIQEAKKTSSQGERAKRISLIEKMHLQKVFKNTIISIVWGGVGVIYTWFFVIDYPLNFMWLIAFMGTSPAITASRYADNVTFAASKFVNDKDLCV